jgi:hypothetical protein
MGKRKRRARRRMGVDGQCMHVDLMVEARARSIYIRLRYGMRRILGTRRRIYDSEPRCYG